VSVNKYQPHVLVLPEDDANRQLANGFLLDPFLLTRQIQVLSEVGGWKEVIDCFLSDHVSGMDKYSSRFMVLLLDFDRQNDRGHAAMALIPHRLIDRVFVLGVWSEPEALKGAGLGSYETIGRSAGKRLPREYSYDLGTPSLSTQCRGGCPFTPTRSTHSVSFRLKGADRRRQASLPIHVDVFHLHLWPLEGAVELQERPD